MSRLELVHLDPPIAGRATRRARPLILAVGLTTVAACGVPIGDSTFEEIPAGEISPGLAAPATSTTTTTTTTLPELTETTVPTTTVVPETLETLEIYFVSRGSIRPLEQTSPAPVVEEDLIGLLESGPPESAPPNIDTAVPRGLVNDVDVSAGVVTIDLDETVFERIARRDQQRAIAQMVFTFVLNLPGVGQALFTLDGSAIAVPRGDNRLTADPVSVDDYANLLADSLVDVAPTTSTTTSTTTTTTVAAASDTSTDAQPQDEEATDAGTADDSGSTTTTTEPDPAATTTSTP